MCLIEVADLVHHVEDGHPLPEQNGRVPGPFDLYHLAMRDAGGAQEVPLRTSNGAWVDPTEQGIVDDWIARQQAAPRQTGHEAVDVLEVRILPGGSSSQNARADASGNVASRRSRTSPGGRLGMNVPSVNRMPSHSPSGGQSPAWRASRGREAG